MHSGSIEVTTLESKIKSAIKTDGTTTSLLNYYSLY